MYAVVGCSNCGALWLLSDPDSAQTAKCQRCGKTHRTHKLKRFFESDDRTAAREARAALLAKKHGDAEAFAEVDHVADLEAQLDESAVDDAEYLAGVGLDPDRVAAAGDVSGGRSRSRDEILREAVDSADREDDIIAYAVDHGVPADAARSLLEKLRQRGEVSESGGRYRLL